VQTQDIIHKKRLGEKLTDSEIGFIWDGYLRGTVSEAQLAALAMAIVFQDLDTDELTTWTSCMIDSGQRLSYADNPSLPLVDKHSTGGVGDKVSLVLAPLMSAAGFRVPMISGRSLGYTGGTLDKLEAINGFSVSHTPAELTRILSECGCFIAAATDDLVPADKRLYALRDVTSTIASPALIASSIMSKKIASGVKHLVLDVKFGKGAFCETYEAALTLARRMVGLGNASGVRTIACLTSMDRLIGLTAGNAAEVRESLDTLGGEGPADLTDLVLNLAEGLAELAGKPVSRAEFIRLLKNGDALTSFATMCALQGASLPLTLKAPTDTREILAPRSAKFEAPLAEGVARAAFALGSGRSLPEDDTDPTAGVTFLVAPGTYVHEGTPIALLETSRGANALDEAERYVYASLTDVPAARVADWIR
jgi:thymidine phosphorylase